MARYRERGRCTAPNRTTLRLNVDAQTTCRYLTLEPHLRRIQPKTTGSQQRRNRAAVSKERERLVTHVMARAVESDDEGGGERWAWEQEGQEQEGSISGALPPPSHHESEVHDPRPKGPRGSSSLMDVASGKNRGPDDSWDEADGKVGAAGEEEEIVVVRRKASGGEGRVREGGVTPGVALAAGGGDTGARRTEAAAGSTTMPQQQQLQQQQQQQQQLQQRFFTRWAEAKLGQYGIDAIRKGRGLFGAFAAEDGNTRA